jgi:hypothetical protein
MWYIALSALRRTPKWVKWGAPLALLLLVFRKALVFFVVGLVASLLSLGGVHLHIPRLSWPWSQAVHGTTTTVSLGPSVLQKIEGISKPALGQANFSFYFTRKVTKSIGPWPCWYQASFYADGHASATVNPGPSWWAKGMGHYTLTISGKREVSVAMVLPKPQLPMYASQVVIDNLSSRPVDVQHSWTYPGLGCGVIIRPQFSVSVLYAQAQYIAFYKATKSPWVTGALSRAAENEAVTIIRDNFIQPTVNALGYKLVSFTMSWV